MKRVVLIGVILILAGSHWLTAQTDPRFYRVFGNNGKKIGKINGIGQDTKGYMWFLAQDDHCIYRFDGSRWITFKHDNTDSTSLGQTNMETLYVDTVGTVWIGGAGLDRLDVATGRFQHFNHVISDPTSLSGLVLVILRDSKKRVWVGTSDGLDLMDEKTGKFTHFKNDPSDPRSLSNNHVRSLYEDHNGTIWIGSGEPFFYVDPEGGGLNRLNDDGTFTRYLHDPNDPQSLINNKVRSMFEDSRGVFWVGTSGDGLHTMDRKTGKFTRHLYDPAHPDRLSRGPLQKDAWHNYNDQVTFIKEDQLGKIWIGTMWSGMNRYDTTTKKVTHFEGSHGFPDSSTWCSGMSRDGIFWVATLNNKLYRIDPNPNKIMDERMKYGIHSLYQDSAGSIWATATGSLHLFDEAFKHLKVYRTTIGNGDDEFYSVFPVAKDTLWLATSSGIVAFQKTTHQFFRPNLGKQAELLNTRVMNFSRERNGGIWISTWGRGMIHCDPSTSRLKQYLPDPNDNEQFSANAFVRAVNDVDGSVWMASMKGIAHWDPKSDRLKTYLKFAKVPFVEIDSSGRLWAGTSDGLYQYNRKEDVFMPYFERHSDLAANPIYGIVEDDERNLWIKTSSNLAVLNRDRTEYLIFGEQFGIETNLLGIGGVQKTKKGEILITKSDEGFLRFSPKELTAARQVDIKVTDLFVNTDLALPGKGILERPIDELSDLTLLHDQNSLTFYFSVMDYVMPEAIHYFSRLEGYNDTWREALEDKSSYYYNVPPGDYVYHIRAYGSAGIKAERLLKITIDHPWWDTNIAYAGYGLAVFGLLIIGRRAIIQRERLKSNLKLEQIEREKNHIQLEKAREVDRMKTSFFTNISHEFRTPLTLIKGPAQNLLEEFSSRPKVKNQLESIERNADHLLKLINQLLDLAKLETGNLTLKETTVELNVFLRATIHSFSSAALLKGIDVLPQLPTKPYKVSLDQDKVETIINNLIGNALKFTQREGRIVVDANVSELLADGRRKLTLRVSDTGIGISAEHRSRIFDRFYQVNDEGPHQQMGTGIGLSLVRELVVLMGGTIHVNSEPGKGSEFVVELPLTRVDLLTSERPDVLIGGPVDVANGNEKEEFIENGNGVSVKPRILVVEDHADLRQFIISSLGTDYDFLEAGDGAAGLETAIREIPDMIISDVMMPVMDGVVMTGKVRHDARTRHIPVIILTAKAGDENKLQGLTIGADDYLTKPFNKKELVVKVRNGIESRNRVREKVRLEMLKEAPVIEVISGDEQFLTQVRETILRRLSDEQLSVDSLAKEIGWSRAQFYRKVTALTGQSVNELIRSFRLNKAAQLLASKWGPVSQVAFEVGFSNPSYFSKCFKDEFGVLPSEYVSGS